MGSLKQVYNTRVEDLSFRIYTEEEIEKISAVHVTKDDSFNNLGHYVDKGIYDLHMGPMSQRDNDLCKTCGNTFFTCIGHCGHLSLPLPVFNPFFYDILKDVLQRICPSCFRFSTKEKLAIRFIYECKFLFAGYDQMALEVESLVREILSDPLEALEDTMHVDESINPNSCGIAEIRSLTTELHKIFEQTKKTQIPFQSPTCNSQSVYTQLRTKFLQESKKNKKNCLYCKRKLLSLKYQNSKIMNKDARRTIVNDDDASPTDSISESQPYLIAEQTRTMLRECFVRDGEILKSLYPILASIKVDKTKNDKARPTDIFFIQKLLVIPPKHRPCNKINEKLIENDMSVLYKRILQQSKCLRYMIKMQKNGVEMAVPEAIRFLMEELGGKTNYEKILNLWGQLQEYVDKILDSELNSNRQPGERGVRQIFEKKFGVIRRHLMGKRSDYSGRSVAAPDPWLAVDQVGVPIEFALKLTYPVPVTPWNVGYLRKLVQNGPLNYPGALYVEDEQGRKVSLKADDYKQRNALAQGLLTPSESCVKNVNVSKIVYRHLHNGDYVLMNRQPTLHKPSIQAHKARVMPKDRVLRLPYASCKAYNADFDGDELNLHFPQNETARSESQYIITTRNQYLTPKDGAPLSGLIQDCVVASVKLTMRGKFFNLGDYQELVFVALSHLPHKIRLLPPTILKPQRLWSGKQIISTILLNLISEKKSYPSFVFKTTVKDDMWLTQPKRLWKVGQPPDNKKLFMSESEFIMREGELVCGVVDKCAIGSTSYGLVHVCYDLYGGEVASQVLTSINRLCVFYLQWVGHTISLKEFVTPKDASLKRREELKSLIQRTKYDVSNKLRIHEDDLEDHIEVIHKSENEKEMSVIDAAYTSSLGPTTSTIIRENEQNLYRSNLQNNMRMMIDTGSKGSRVNMNQMASLFGSVAIDGKRMPISVTGKSLPSFKSYECDPRSGGYIPTRFVTGMDPRSYFFLCIVGRDSLQHTAVKTANSGYMQRCLIKHLEGISVKYDNTVRNSDGVVLQFEYGEDGLDVTKVPFLRSIDTIDSILQSEKICLNVVPEVEKHKKTIKKCKSEFSDEKRVGGFLKFSSKAKENSQLNEILQSPEKIEKLISSWRCMYTEEKEALRSKNLSHTDVGHSIENEVLMGLWYAKSDEEKLKLSKLEKLKRKNVTVASKFFGTSQCQFGVVSEALDDLIDQYYDERYSKRRVLEQPLTAREVREILYMKALKSKVDPGEAVGALCAQAIGEPLTQMTLNTFHFAGRDELNVTLGVPRMIEILRTASPNINTPIMEIPFKDGVSKSVAEKLKKKLTPVPLMKMVSEITVTSSLERSSKLFRRAVIRFSLHPYEVYKNVYYVKPFEVLRFMEKNYFKKHLLKSIQDAVSKVSSFMSTSSRKKDDDDTEERTVTRGLEEADSDDEVETKNEEQEKEFGVSGADKQGTTKERDFSEDEEEELENGDDDSDDDVEANRAKVKQERDIDDPDSEDDMEQKFNPNKTNIKEEFISDKKKSSTTPKSQKKKNGNINIYSCRKNNVIADDAWIVNYDFDDESSLWCEITLELPIAEGRYDLVSILKKTSESCLVHNMPGIKKVYVVEKDGRFLLRSEGVNIKEIFTDKDALAYLDINRFYTNNIHFMAQRYGIEAAQRCVIKEIREVQSAYDITVDFRHLSLLSDYFTCEGIYKACSRMALDTCASMIQKMSFETCFAFMKKSLLQDLSDSMYSPSASVMVGQPVKLGTNSMGIIMNGNLL